MPASVADEGRREDPRQRGDARSVSPRQEVQAACRQGHPQEGGRDEMNGESGITGQGGRLSGSLGKD